MWAEFKNGISFALELILSEIQPFQVFKVFLLFTGSHFYQPSLLDVRLQWGQQEQEQEDLLQGQQEQLV